MTDTFWVRCELPTTRGTIVNGLETKIIDSQFVSEDELITQIESLGRTISRRRVRDTEIPRVCSILKET